MNIKICTTVASLQQALDQERAQGKSIGFIPTMGALHEGHRSLVERALQDNDIAVCSIFVNPTQFNDLKDLENYPRMEDADLRLLDNVSCQYAFIPSFKEVYPSNGELLSLDFGLLENTMEGSYRPGHFKGVATVVDRLFNIVKPDRAYFGEKDFQQLAIIRAMAKILGHAVKIIGCPTLRESTGLAMSSRNLLLSPDQHKAAVLIYKALLTAQEFIPHHTINAVKDLVTRYIEQSSLLKVQYFNIVDTETLESLVNWDNRHSAQGCIAVLTEGPRLIDNIRYTF